MVDSLLHWHHLKMAPRRSTAAPEPDIREPFLLKLKAFLESNKDAGVTAAGLSKQAGLADNAIRRWLAGTSKSLTIASARSVCLAMGTTLEEFLSSAQTAEERTIVALAAQLPDELLQRLLTYGEGLRDAQHLTQKASLEDTR